MKVLVACEFSGVVRDAFIRAGHDAVSCDLIPSESPNPGGHYTGNVLDIIDRGWDLMIAHPPCTYLSISGLHWNKRRPGRARQTAAALTFVRALMSAHIPRICIENPVSCISTRIQPPSQIIQPYDFGHDASKKTCLWLKNLPRLKATAHVPPARIVDGLPRWANQTASGQNKLPSTRSKDRAVTYAGIAQAMADQWGGIWAMNHWDLGGD